MCVIGQRQPPSNASKSCSFRVVHFQTAIGGDGADLSCIPSPPYLMQSIPYLIQFICVQFVCDWFKTTSSKIRTMAFRDTEPWLFVCLVHFELSISNRPRNFPRKVSILQPEGNPKVNSNHLLSVRTHHLENSNVGICISIRTLRIHFRNGQEIGKCVSGSSSASFQVSTPFPGLVQNDGA